MKKIMITTMLLALTTMGFSKDIKTVVVTTTPQMHCENCENTIKGNLRFEKGVKEIATDIEAQKVTIKYDAEKTSEEKILKGFEKFKYTARVVKEGEVIEYNADEECKNM